MDDVILLLKKWGSNARVVAGNTTLYELSNQGGLDDVRTLIDIMNLGLNYIKEDKNRMLHVGSTTTFIEIASSSVFDKKPYYALREVCSKITPPQVRNTGTIGGSICSAIPFYDIPTVLLALDAKIKVVSVEGERYIGVDDFFIDYFVTALSPEELLIEVQIPFRQLASSSFVKLGRTSADFAIVNAAVMVCLDSNTRHVTCARISLGAVASTPIRHKKAEKYLVGKEASEDTIDAAASVPVDFEPTPSIQASSSHKKRVIPFIIKEALSAAVRRAEEQGMRH